MAKYGAIFVMPYTPTASPAQHLAALMILGLAPQDGRLMDSDLRGTCIRLKVWADGLPYVAEGEVYPFVYVLGAS